MAVESEKNKQSPLKSLASFRSEIMDMQLHDPGEGASTKSSSLQNLMNSIVVQVVVLLLVFICVVATTTELLVEINIIQVQSDGLSLETLLEALSATTLSILSVFIIEVLLRLIGMGASFFKSKLEIFDVAIVLIAFILDLVFHVCGVNEEYPGTIAASNLIILRCWRFYGIINSELIRVRRMVSEEMDMERYARRQAEAQADALQSQCDHQLKEITQLRDALLQNDIDPESVWSNRPTDMLRSSNREYKSKVKRLNGPVLSTSSYNSDLIYAIPSKTSSTRGVSRDISFSSRETLPKSTPLSRLSQVSSTYDVPADAIRTHQDSSEDSKRHSFTDKFASTLSRNIIRDAIYSLTQTMASISNGQEGYINFAFDHNVEDGSSQKDNTIESNKSSSTSENSAETTVRDGSRTPLAFVNQAFDSDSQRASNIESSMTSTRSFEYSLDSSATKHQESLEVPRKSGSDSDFGSDRHSYDHYSSKSSLHLPLSGQNSSSNSSRLDADEEEQLRLELEEIKRLSEEALLQELGQTVTSVDDRGIPTTSL